MAETNGEEAVGELPRKDFYKINEVCRYTDTQPYVLRFWESEFPQLNPERRGDVRLYSRADVDLVCRIKQLLYDEEHTLADARQKLEEESGASRRRGAEPKAARASRSYPRPVAVADDAPRVEERAAQPAEPAQTQGAASGPDAVPRSRYEDAIDEIDHLRLQLREAELRGRRAESSADEARGLAETERERALRAGERIARLLDSLS